MLFPVRCPSCNKPIAQFQREYEKQVQNNISKEKILNSLNINRMCCRRVFLGYVGFIDQLTIFPHHIQNRSSKKT